VRVHHHVTHPWTCGNDSKMLSKQQLDCCSSSSARKRRSRQPAPVLSSRPKHSASRRHCRERHVEDVKKNASTTSSTTAGAPGKAEERQQQAPGPRSKQATESTLPTRKTQTACTRTHGESADSPRAAGSTGPFQDETQGTHAPHPPQTVRAPPSSRQTAQPQHRKKKRCKKQTRT